MDLQHSSMPEPADALSARRPSVRPNRASILPPPLGRSPIKTSLGSSPRRQSSMGPPSAMRRSSNTPNRAISQPTVARRLDFGAADERITKANGSASRNQGKPRSSVYSLPTSPEPARGKKRSHDESVVEDETVLEESEHQPNRVGEDSPLPATGDESLQMVVDGEETEVDEENVEDSTEIPEPEPEPTPQSKPQPPKNRRKSLEHREMPAPRPGPGRPKKNQGLVSAKQTSMAQPGRSRKVAQARPATNEHVRDESTMEVDQSDEERSVEEQPLDQVEEEEAENEKSEEKFEEMLEDEPEQEPTPEPEPVPAKKKRGRPKAGSRLEIPGNEVQDQVNLPERPAKKSKKAPIPKKPPPSERDPNARVTSKSSNSKSKKKGNQKEDMPPPPLPIRDESQQSQSRQRSQTRSLQVLRQGTPFEDEGARTTRSGRISAKPLEFWRNERIEYAHDGTKKEIIRAEDIQEPKRPTRRNTALRGRPKQAESVIGEEDEGIDPEDWEVNEGIIQGWVNGWDEKQGIIVDPGSRNEDIAFSAAKIQTREVRGANFQYSKLLGLPYLGAGMVDLPPHGSKRSKNSRKMHMVFCVLTGKVNATVGETVFSISKGGVWMVPRGNFYSITNEMDVPARLFFAQGCEVHPEDENEDDENKKNTSTAE
ncbi:Mif2/CENP-C like-domain-containing protein [Macrophomina phaseolina]|uniref:Mif2/CENP-C like-domain-containing protein n=1 Tax=Macrophomina phaseolina TaxID=35725 RepID=A0ABQ8FTE1_9PEZI|nr:Mif2/CENP-C like-domain-containing protein [Macrophomina phaseolina]